MSKEIIRFMSEKVKAYSICSSHSTTLTQVSSVIHTYVEIPVILNFGNTKLYISNDVCVCVCVCIQYIYTVYTHFYQTGS